ncbi:winged helix-turn-helix domain-containing protein [Ferrimonas kyonanensis]|uniref:winged helix-turn-helix domain-containing protein n=1 Tax=Ferrimonas kyonanensis TaxID=364763 RepID=UPI0003FE7496|nr:winged helix-turn-helix domain-containing protein [Ferrimonas kyonanensis]
MQKQLYQIDNWLFIPHENACVLDGERMEIDNRLSNLLLFLCQHPHTVFSRDQLMESVWHGAVLTDQVITQSIFELRKILKTNQRHPQGYIITVPKRGYKLDADVTLHPSSAEKGASDSGSIHSQSTLPPQDATPNGDGPGSPILNPRSIGLAAVAMVFGMLIMMAIHQLAPPASPAPSTARFSKLEPRVISISYVDNVADSPIENGIVFKILEYLKYNENFSLARNGDPQGIAGKQLSFIISQQDGDDYINIEYFNNVSEYLHLDRKYRIDPANLLPVMKRMLTDLLHALQLDIPEQRVDAILQELPENPQALALAISAIGVTFDRNDSDKLDAVDYNRRALALEPNNQFLIATNYLFSMATLYLDPKSRDIEAIDTLNREFEQRIPALLPEPSSYKAYEALALNALYHNDELQALQYAERIPHTHDTILGLLIQAKIAETFGNTASATEYYYRAIHESGTAKVLLVAENLLFYSDLSHIRQKLGIDGVH